MRGAEMTGSLFSYVDLEERIPARHPLRKIRQSSTMRGVSRMRNSTSSTPGRAVPPSRLNG